MKTKITTLLLLVLTVFFSCKKDTKKPDNIYKFKEYISYTTSGVVSTSESILINFAKNVEGWENTSEVPSELFSIKPYVSGNIHIVNNHSFVFKPDEPLKSDTEFTVTVKLNEIYKNVPKDFESYTFQFKTITPNFSIQTGVLQSYDKNYQYLEGSLKSADVITLENAKKIIEATQKGIAKHVVWDESYINAKQFDFKIDSIQRFEDDSKLIISWNGKPINAKTNGENEVVIPGKNQFKVIDVSYVNSVDSYLSINFSDALKKQQNFEGLISIKDQKNPRFIINGNELKVFSENKFQGEIVLQVFEGIKNTYNYKLQKPFKEVIVIEQIKPQIKALSNGVILPNSANLTFNFEAINVKEVDVRVIKIFENNILQFLQEDNLNSNNAYAIKKVGRRIAKKTITLIKDEELHKQKWKAYSVDISKIITVDPGAIYRVELSFNKDQVLYDCDNASISDENSDEYDEYDEYQEVNEIDDQELREELYWDNELYSYKKYRYNWRERNNPCNEAYYSQNKIVAQNLLATNLGIIAKKGNMNSYFFAVTNILTTQPEAASKVQLFNFQQQEIASGTTNSEGIVTIKSDKNAAFAIVSKGNNKGYIKLFDGNSLSLSNFDVSGTKTQKGLKGYLYGERGVWRPGDTIHLSFILNDADNKLPKNHPVKLEVTDPSGKLVFKEIASQNIGNFYKFTINTNTDGKTGNYTAKVTVGGAKFTKNLKVETVKPNRLKIKIDFSDEILSSKNPIDGNLDVKWLHGTPAKNVKAEINAKVSASNSGFSNFKDYVFSDPSRKYDSEEITIFDGKLSNEGTAKINNDIKIGKNAPGLLNIQFLVRAFESGGDFSIDAFTKKYAPYNTFVGLKSPKGNQYGSYFTDENQTFSVVTVDEKGTPVANKELVVELYQVQWRWWWSSSYDNLSKYTSSSYHKPYKTFAINTKNEGKTTFSINIPDENRGRFLLRVIDKNGGHAAGRTAYFYKNWWQNSTSENKDAAKMLVFSADKENYNVGETATITFPSGENGRALISIENGTKVLQTKWVNTQKETTTVPIVITKDMAPNAFVNISLLQPHQVTENDLPIRLYGVIPILVKDKSTKLLPKIEMPKELKPEQEFTVKVSEANNKAMTYTLAIVEEGLLDLTRFTTPNAYETFYAREALGVKTWDIFDDVIGAYSGSIDQIFAIGGDGSLAKGKNNKANRFKPVVQFLGPFQLNKGEEKSHKIKLPNYIGSVRTMVVAGNVATEAFGSVEETTPVKKPVMVLATLPRKLSPKEKVILPVTVFAMDKKVNNVSVQVKTSNGLQVVKDATQTLKFDKPDEKMLYFELDVLNTKGVQTVEVIASGAGEKSSYKVNLNVINPNPITTKITDDRIEGNQSKSISFSPFGVEGTNSAMLELATLPNINFSGRLEYLIQYPHGCVEQTTSSVFPQLYLTDLFELSSSKKQEIQKNIEKGIARLGNFQKANGGFSYWMGEEYIDDWGTNYAGHFLLEAERKGFVLPLTFKSNFIQYQKQATRNWRPSYNEYSTDLSQAYRLYTLALAGSADLSAMNRLREVKQISNDALWRLAAAYALVGQKEAATEIMEKADYNFASYHPYNYGSIARNKAMALETLILTDKETKELANAIAKELSSDDWMSTQTTAYCLLSIGKLVVKNGGKSININLTANSKNEDITTNKPLVQKELVVNKGANTISIKNNESNLVYARIISSGKLPLGDEIEEKRGFNASISYKDVQGNSIDIKNLKQGQDFVAQITVSNPKNEDVNDIALTQIFPSGWEIVNTRFTDFGSSIKSEARYTDIKDDRVHFYFDLQKKRNAIDTKTFTVLLNAAYLGTYYLPGIQVEAMYDNDYLVRTKGTWVNVIK